MLRILERGILLMGIIGSVVIAVKANEGVLICFAIIAAMIIVTTLVLKIRSV